MTKPVHLTRAQVFPLVAALAHREIAIEAGATFVLPPFPDCPTCGQMPTELRVSNGHGALFLEDRAAFGFRPCGHVVTAAGEDIAHAYDTARRELS